MFCQNEFSRRVFFILGTIRYNEKKYFVFCVDYYLANCPNDLRH